ncbi:MAG: ATP-dependent sacrificial sulfur transferase LarE [Candidatus Hodarchaeales archaeon]
MDAVLKKKINIAVEPIKDKSVLVAFSGGVDSSVVARILKTECKDVKLVTITSKWISNHELDDATDVAKTLGISHQIFPVEVDEDHLFWNNPPDRCFHCKLMIFSQLQRLAEREGYDLVVDGTNASDTSGHRPGLKALEKLEVYSPLLSGGLTKGEVRRIAEYYDLAVAQKPAMACLASRIPYGEQISTDKLERVEKAEEFLRAMSLGTHLRVRAHGKLARIELASFPDLNQKELTKIVENLKSFGFDYVTIDLEGYRPITPN